MARTIGRVNVDVYAQTQAAERAIARIQNIANKPINLNIKGDAGQSLGRISGQASEFQKSMEASNARVIAFGASAGIIFGVQRAFTELFKATVNVEKKLNDIKVILNTSQSAFSTFGAALFDIANKTGQSFDVAADAALELARQGLGLEATLKRTQAALSLTRISGLEVEKSVNAITAAINSFNRAAIEDINLVSKIANVDTRFAVSAQDLAEALSRVGSTAQSAGVNIDELLGLVTATQQITARGGAVIGNAFKSIFTRLERSTTIQQLRDLGVEIDNTQTGIQKLNVLAEALKSADAGTANTIKQLTGGVYQINVVSAALEDLGKQYGLTAMATKVAAESTNEIEDRVKSLNEVLGVLITQTLNNFARLGSIVGGATLGPGLKSFLTDLNNSIEGVSDNLSKEQGFNIGKSILDGIGDFLTGPGLFGIVTIFGTLFRRLAGFLGKAAFQLTQNSAQLELQAQIARQVSTALAAQPGILQGIANKTLSVADAEKLVIQAVRQKNTELITTIGLMDRISRSMATSGYQMRDFSAGSDKYPTLIQQVRPTNTQGAPRTRSSGHIPSPIEKFAEAQGAYAGGYKPGEIKTMNMPKIGRVVYNSAEQVKRFEGLDQPAIIPPKGSKAGRVYREDFVKKLGFDPYRNKSQGNIPNKFNSGFIPDQIKSGGAIPNFLPPTGKFLGRGVMGSFHHLKNFKGIEIGKKSFTDINDVDYRNYEVQREYIASKFLELNSSKMQRLAPYVYPLKTVGSLKRSKERGYIGKETVVGRTLGDIDFGLQRNYKDNTFIRSLSQLTKNSLQQIGLDPATSDLHFGNIMVNSKLDNYIKKISNNDKLMQSLRNANFSKGGLNTNERVDQILRAIGKKGGKVYPIDTGAFEFEHRSNLSPPRPIFFRSNGLVPNFAKIRIPKNLNNTTISERMAATFDKGKDYKDFYSIVNSAFSDPKDASVYANIASALSPMVPDYVAGKAAIKAYQYFKKTGSTNVEDYINLPIDVGNYKYLRQLGHLDKGSRKIALSKALKGQPLGAHNTDKTRHYANALSGDADSFPIDTNVIQTILGKGKKGSFVRSDSRRVIKLARQLSSNLGVEPRQLQAGIFKGNSKYSDRYNVGFAESIRDALSSGLSQGSIPNFRLPVDKLGQYSFKHPLGKAHLGDMNDSLATVDFIKTFERGKGHSRIIYKDLFEFLKKNGYEGVRGFLLNQSGITPRSKSPVDQLTAKYPQIMRGEFGQSNMLDLIAGENFFELSGGKNFKQQLAKRAPFILREQQRLGVEDLDFTTFFNKGIVPNFNLFPKRVPNKKIPFDERSFYHFSPVNDIKTFKPRDYDTNNSSGLGKLEPTGLIHFSPKPNVLDRMWLTNKEGTEFLGKGTEYETKLKLGNVFDSLNKDNQKLLTFLLDSNKNETYKEYSKRIPSALRPPIGGEELELIEQSMWKKIGYKNLADFLKHHNYDSIKLNDNNYGILRGNQAKIIGKRNVYDGLIPNFNNPLAHAIKRESSAGIAPSKIRVTKHPRLSSPQNKRGLGVYNTDDEPQGILQGIKNVAKMGINPKNYQGGFSDGSVPNFVLRDYRDPITGKVYRVPTDPDPVPDPVYPKEPKFQSFNPQKPPSAFKFDFISTSGKSSISADNIEKINQASDEILKGFTEVGKRFGNTNKYYELEENLEKIVKASGGSEKAMAKVKTQLEKNVNSVLEYRKTVSKVQRTHQAELQVRERLVQETATQKDDLLRRSGTLLGGFNRRTRREADITAQEDPEFNARLGAVRNDRSQRLAGRVLQASFLLPMVSSAIQQSIGRESLRSRQVGGGVDILSQTASTAALGGTIGGPYGALLGGAFGALTSFSQNKNSFTSDLPERQKEFDRISQKLEQFNNSVTQYAQALEKYQTGLADVSGAVKPQDLLKFRNDLVTKMFEVPDEFRSRIIASSADAKIFSKTMGELSEELGKAEKAARGALKISEYQEKFRQGFLDFTTLDFSKPKEIKEIEGDLTRILGTGFNVDKVAKTGPNVLDSLSDVLGTDSPDNRKKILDIANSLEEQFELSPEIISAIERNVLKQNGGSQLFGKILFNVLSQILDGKTFEKITENTQKRVREINAKYIEINDRITKNIQSLTISLSSAINSQLTQVKVGDRSVRNQRSFNVDRQLEGLSGGLRLGQPFLSERGTANANAAIQSQKIEADRLKAIQELTAQSRSKVLDTIAQELQTSVATLTRQFLDADKDRGETAADISQQNIAKVDTNTFGKLFSFITEEIKKNPLQGVPNLSAEQIQSVIGGSPNTAQNIATSLQNISIEQLAQLRDINEQMDQQQALLKISNSYERQQAEQTRQLSLFGGAQNFLDENATDRIAEMIRKGLATSSSGSVLERGRFAAQNIQNLTENLGISGENIPAGLKSQAVEGRRLSILQEIDLAEISQKLTGSFNSDIAGQFNNLRQNAGNTAGIQIKSLQKFDNLPNDVFDISSKLTTLRDTINSGLQELARVNEFDKFDKAIKANGLNSVNDTLQKILAQDNAIIRSQLEQEKEVKKANIDSQQGQAANLRGDLFLKISDLAEKVVAASTTNPTITQLPSFANLQKFINEPQSFDSIEGVNKLISSLQDFSINNPEQKRNLDPALNAVAAGFLGGKALTIKPDSQNELSRRLILGENNVTQLAAQNIAKSYTGVQSTLEGFKQELESTIARLAKINSVTSVSNQSNNIKPDTIQNFNKVGERFGLKPSNRPASVKPSIPSVVSAITPKPSVFDKQNETIAQEKAIISRRSAENAVYEQKSRDLGLEILETQTSINVENAKEIKDLDIINKGYEALVKLNKERNQLLLAAAKTRQEEMRRDSTVFSDELAGQTLQTNELRARDGSLQPRDLGTQFLDTLSYSQNTLMRDLNQGIFEIGENMKSSFKGGFKEFIDGSKSATEALRSFALNVADKMLDVSLDIGVNSLFSGLGNAAGGLFGRSSNPNSLFSNFGKKGFNKGGKVKGYASGGLVTGGSGNKDDVAAMLTSGEFVINKATTQAVGPEFLEALNKREIKPTEVKALENGAYVRLLNDIYTEGKEPVTQPESYKIAFDPTLSNFALTNEDSPANNRRFQKEQDLISYIQGRNEYEKQKKEALKQFERGQKQRIIGALINAGITIGGAGLSQMNMGARGMPTAEHLDKRFGAMGNSIPQFAQGGYNADNVPALLTGGEFVMTRDAVNAYGADFFDKLNQRGIQRFAEGGPVGNVTRLGTNNDKLSDYIYQLSNTTEAINETLSALKTTVLNGNKVGGAVANTTGGGAINNYVTIEINIEDAGKVSANTTAATSTENNDNNSEQKRRADLAEQQKELANIIQVEVVKVINREQRNGGLLARNR